MSIAGKYRPQFTYDDYVTWEGRWELIEGMPYAMSPASALRHQIMNGNLYSIFKASLKRSGKECSVYLPVDWRISHDTVVQPDLLIACKPIDKQFLDFTPDLTLEILSPSTAFKDRHEKFELYEQQGVKYYVIVDQTFKKVEVWELKEGKYCLLTIDSPLVEFLFDDCRIEVDLAGAWL